MSTGSYLEIGTVKIGGEPPGSKELVEFIGAVFDVKPAYKERAPLAGPNDILHILMSAAQWEALLPWAKDQGFGVGASILSGYIFYRLGVAKSAKKIEAIDEKLTKLTDLLEKMHREIRDNEEHNQFCNWDVRFGLWSAEQIELDPARASVAIEVPSRSVACAADAVLALSTIGAKLEAEINEFHAKKIDENDVRRVSGVIKLESSGRLSATLHFWSSKGGAVEPKTIAIDPAQPS